MSRIARDDARDASRGGWLIARPLWGLVALDVTGIALAAAAVGQLGDPDILLHVVWIVLALEAFTFGLRTAALRIAAATIFVVAYAFVANGDATPAAAGMTDLDLEEWPLMAVIAILVAVMADRVTNTGRRYAALYRAASDRLLTAQEDERKRLAADLHDGVGQTLTALTLTLDAADAALASPGAPSGAGREAVHRAREMAGMALEDVRGVAFRLRPARLRETGLVAALRELAASAGVPVEFSADASLARPDLLDPAREVDTYRIVQEALGNAARHGKAARVEVRVRRVDRTLRIEVADDGVGFDPRTVAGRGLGLASMHDRTVAIGGTLQVRSRPGMGTLVRLEVPLADAVVAALVLGVAGPGTGSGAAPAASRAGAR
jgi:signal transduction histidine kinase